MEKITIYTCITGNYDKLLQPCLPADGFDFICFVRHGTKTRDYDGVWKIEEIPYTWEDNRLLARSQKLNPQSVLPKDCHWSLWIDGNIKITNDNIYKVCRELQQKNVKFAGIHHPFSDCVYQEAAKCLSDRRESMFRVFRVVAALRKAQVPEHAGLMETNLLFRKHNDPAVLEFDRKWWEYLVRYTNRDQLTQVMALRETPSLQVDYLFPPGISSRNYDGLEYVRHPSPQLSWFQRKLKFGLNKPKCLLLNLYSRICSKAYKR